jgi:hypothetical protein
MNNLEEAAESLTQIIENENALLTDVIKKSCTRMQSVIDRTTTLIYKHAQQELDFIQALMKPGYSIIIYPAINWYGNDIAPSYAAEVKVTYHIVCFNLEANRIEPLYSGPEIKYFNASDDTFDNAEFVLKEKLKDLGLDISTYHNKDIGRNEALQYALEKRNATL